MAIEVEEPPAERACREFAEGLHLFREGVVAQAFNEGFHQVGLPDPLPISDWGDDTGSKKYVKAFRDSVQEDSSAAARFHHRT